MDGKNYLCMLRPIYSYEVVKKWDDSMINNFISGGCVATLTGDKKHIVFGNQGVGQELPHDNIAIVDAETLEFVKLMSHPGKIMGLTSSPDGMHFVTYSDDGRWDEKKVANLILWDAQIFDKIQVMATNKGNESHGAYGFYNITFSPDSKMLATSVNGEIIIYDMDTMEKIEGIEYINEKIGSIDGFSPNSDFLVGIGFHKVTIVKIKPCEKIYSYENLKPNQGIRDISLDLKYILVKTGLPGNSNLILLNANWEGTGVEDIDKDFSLDIYPNPTGENTEIEYYLPNSGNVIINITNQKGISNVLLDGFSSQDKNTFTFNTSQYTSGQYFLRLRFADKEITQKLIISK